MRQIRLLIAEILIGISFHLLPRGKEKTALALWFRNVEISGMDE